MYKMREWRHKNHLTSSYISHYLGISKKDYLQLEGGHRTVTIFELVKLSQLYHAPIKDILSDQSINSAEVQLNVTSTEDKKEIAKLMNFRCTIPQLREIMS